MRKEYTELQTKFLTGIIPDNWNEKVFETDTHYRCDVKGERLSDNKWDELFECIKGEFGDGLMEVYSITSNGINFEVYLKKGNE